MILIVRTRDRLKETLNFFQRGFPQRKAVGLGISKTTLIPAKIPTDIDALIITSPSALLAIKNRDKPLYCVGRISAQHALEQGFRVLYTGDSNAEDLAKHVAKTYPTQKILHVAGDLVKNDWYSILEKAGSEISYVESYKTELISELNENDLTNTKKSKIVLLFSYEGARRFYLLAKKYKLNLKEKTVIALSDKVISSPIICEDFAEVIISKTPNREAIAEALKEVLNKHASVIKD